MKLGLIFAACLLVAGCGAAESVDGTFVPANDSGTSTGTGDDSATGTSSGDDGGSTSLGNDAGTSTTGDSGSSGGDDGGSTTTSDSGSSGGDDGGSATADSGSGGGGNDGSSSADGGTGGGGDDGGTPSTDSGSGGGGDDGGGATADSGSGGGGGNDGGVTTTDSGSADSGSGGSQDSGSGGSADSGSGGSQDSGSGGPGTDSGSGGGEDGGSCHAPKCVWTQGYYKNHPSNWPALPVVMGSTSYDESQCLALLNDPSTGDASVILAKQYIAAVENGGQCDPAISAVMATAQQWFTTNGTVLPYNSQLPVTCTSYSSGPCQAWLLGQELDNYNSGSDGTPACQ